MVEDSRALRENYPKRSRKGIDGPAFTNRPDLEDNSDPEGPNTRHPIEWRSCVVR